MSAVRLTLTEVEARILSKELNRIPLLSPVKSKLDAQLAPRLPAVIPGQTTVDDYLEES